MDEFFDDLSRKLASTVSRRSALRAFLAALFLGEGCVPSPTGSPSNDCNCSAPKTACCVRHNRCCDPKFPHHCQNTGRCYQFFNDAQNACGTSYEICGGPVG
jgi:hypothetical protein